MDVTFSNPLISPCVNALLELNNVDIGTESALGTLRGRREALVRIGSTARRAGRRGARSRAAPAVAFQGDERRGAVRPAGTTAERLVTCESAPRV